MTIAAEKALTAEEFLELPEVQAGAWMELVKGRVIVSPRPNMFHSYACSILLQILGGHVRSHKLGIVYLELDTVFGVDEVRAPDLLYYSNARLPSLKKKHNDLVPDLCVEFISPSSARVDRIDKFKLYQDKGVACYWIVDPKEQTIEAYTLKDGQYIAAARGRDSQLIKLPPFPELEIPLADLWHP